MYMACLVWILKRKSNWVDFNFTHTEAFKVLQIYNKMNRELKNTVTYIQPFI